jgi:DNA polymerase I-like protein with 3'-5' exonuclease and polymerase domains
VIVKIDGAQLEWRVCAELSEDPTAYQEIVNGLDFHSLNQQTFNLPSRLISKKYLFRTIFNWGKGYAFTVDPEFMHVSTSVKYWDEVGEKFYAKYNHIDKLYRTNRDIVLQGQPLVGPFGRFWPLELKRNYRGELEVPITLLVNYPTQGTGADVMMLARLSLRNRIAKWNIPEIKFISTVHDDISLDSPSQYVQRITDTAHQVFGDLQANIWKLFKYEWKVPLACEVKYGPNMKDMTKVERNG